MNVELQKLLIESYASKLDALAASSGAEKEVIENNLISHLSNLDAQQEADKINFQSAAPIALEDNPVAEFAVQSRGIDFDFVDAVHREFDFDIKAFQIKGTIDFQTGKDWKAHVQYKAYLVGIQVSEQDVILSAENSHINLLPIDIGVASLFLQVGIRQGCFYVKGKVGIIFMTTFDQNIVCF